MREELKSYLAGTKESGLLLSGNVGLPMLSDALKIASILLSTPVEKLLIHPDYLFIDKGDEKSIGVAQSDLIVQKASLLPAVSDKTVIVIDGFDSMTVQAQNKLLKTIEENSSVLVIAVAYTNAVLDTIKSRMRVIEYEPLNRDSFLEFCNRQNLSDAPYFYYASGGCPENRDCEHLTKLYKSIGECILKKNISKIFSLLHLVKEKDKGNFYQTENVRSLFYFLGAFVTDCAMYLVNPANSFFELNSVSYEIETLANCQNNIARALERCGFASYSQDDFFLDIIQIFEYL